MGEIGMKERRRNYTKERNHKEIKKKKEKTSPFGNVSKSLNEDVCRDASV